MDIERYIWVETLMRLLGRENLVWQAVQRWGRAVRFLKTYSQTRKALQQAIILETYKKTMMMKKDSCGTEASHTFFV